MVCINLKKKKMKQTFRYLLSGTYLAGERREAKYISPRIYYMHNKYRAVGKVGNITTERDRKFV